MSLSWYFQIYSYLKYYILVPYENMNKAFKKCTDPNCAFSNFVLTITNKKDKSDTKTRAVTKPVPH
jgi:hypothetical protein